MNVRKGMPSTRLNRSDFVARLKLGFTDPAFDDRREQVEAIIEAAWDAYEHSRKSPHTRRAGPGYHDPSYELAVDWIEASESIKRAQSEYEDRSKTPSVLLINGSPRSDQTCPGEMSKTYRMCKIAKDVFAEYHLEIDYLDLSRLTSEIGVNIHPCKACVSTAMPLCHWPCSCYPNYSLQQANDLMNDIYPLWVRAQGVMIITPVHWYQAPTVLKSMIDRLVCADGGNPDPTSTHGKTPQEAKELELNGWGYPKHLAKRLFSVVVHGDAAGAETLRRILVDWLSDMEMISAGTLAEKDGYVCYESPYATSHEEYDSDESYQHDIRNAAITLSRAIKQKLDGRLSINDEGLEPSIKK